MTIDFIKSEEKLIKTELTIRTSIKNIETLSKIDAFLKKHTERTSEKLSIVIKTAEHLSKDGKLKMPLMVRGKMLGIGRHKKRYYTKEQLMDSVNRYKGRMFPIKLDHRNKEVAATIGTVESISWNNTLNVIEFVGHINDETHARNILDRMTTEVSATIFSIEDYDNTLGIIGTDLEFDELSVVVEGAYKGNSIYPMQ